MKRIKTIMIALVLTMFSIQMAFAQTEIEGAVSGDIVDDVLIQLEGDETVSTRTAFDGTYSFTEVPNGVYVVRPIASGYIFSPGTIEVTVNDVDIYEVDFVSVQSDTLPEEDIDLKDYDLTVWDFSGSYMSNPDNETTLEYTLVQDSKGKLTGTGTFEDLSGGDNMTIPVEIKGKVKGKVRVRVKDEVKETKSFVTVKYKVKGKNAEKDKIKNDINLKLEEDDETTPENETALEGTSKGKICVKGAGCEIIGDSSPAVSLPVPYGMTGEAMLSIDAELDAKGKKLKGTAELILSNDDVYPLVAKGKHNSKKGETKYQIKGDNKTTTKGIKFTIKMDEADNKTRTQIKGKALGQKIDYNSK